MELKYEDVSSSPLTQTYQAKARKCDTTKTLIFSVKIQIKHTLEVKIFLTNESKTYYAPSYLQPVYLNLLLSLKYETRQIYIKACNSDFFIT